MQFSASLAGAWWLLMFVGALVLVAQVPPRRPAEVKQKGDHRPEQDARLRS